MKTTRLFTDLDTQLELAQRFIALDTETTGLDPESNALIEIGALLFEDGSPSASFSTLINPGYDFPNKAEGINHITPDMLKGAPSESDAISAFIKFLDTVKGGNPILVGHNIGFDLSFLTQAFDRIGLTELCFRYVDTLDLARKRIRGLSDYKQSTLTDYLSIENDEAHRALSDAEACGKLLIKLLDMSEKGITVPKKQATATNKDTDHHDGFLF